MSLEVAEEFYSDILYVEIQLDLLFRLFVTISLRTELSLTAGVSIDKRVVMTQWIWRQKVLPWKYKRFKSGTSLVV